MLNEADSSMAANAICYAASATQENIRMVLSEYDRPCVLWKPKLSIDGNQWCALYGDNLQDGVAGFGDTPAKAMHDFDRAWLHGTAHQNEGSHK